jgi:hypothetical protein
MTSWGWGSAFHNRKKRRSQNRSSGAAIAAPELRLLLFSIIIIFAYSTCEARTHKARFCDYGRFSNTDWSAFRNRKKRRSQNRSSGAAIAAPELRFCDYYYFRLLLFSRIRLVRLGTHKARFCDNWRFSNTDWSAFRNRKTRRSQNLSSGAAIPAPELRFCDNYYFLEEICDYLLTSQIDHNHKMQDNRRIAPSCKCQA